MLDETSPKSTNATFVLPLLTAWLQVWANRGGKQTDIRLRTGPGRRHQFRRGADQRLQAVSGMPHRPRHPNRPNRSRSTILVSARLLTGL